MFISFAAQFTPGVYLKPAFIQENTVHVHARVYKHREIHTVLAVYPKGSPFDTLAIYACTYKMFIHMYILGHLLPISKTLSSSKARSVAKQQDKK